MAGMETVVYKASDVMDRLGLKESTFKKYVATLEKEGYVIQKNQQGHRLYTDEDIKTLEMFMKLISYDGVTLESAARQIVALRREQEGHDVITPKEERHDVMTLNQQLLKEQEQRFIVQLQRQEQRFMALLQQQQQLIEQQQQLIQQQAASLEQKVLERLEERDKLLMQSLRETQEVKKMLLESKKKKWWQFWKK